jgi:hypothetical protein
MPLPGKDTQRGSGRGGGRPGPGRGAADVRGQPGEGVLRLEPDFFQQNLLRIVDDVITVIKGSIEQWPTLVEICYFQKDCKGLPQTKVNNLPR